MNADMQAGRAKRMLIKAALGAAVGRGRNMWCSSKLSASANLDLDSPGVVWPSSPG